ncbi:MAG: LLM class flavin-dependent oxidoreductase [Chloroflexi bacterium]|nr:LLM class flavin-dependent oxidoreductase [Chloroflexota bacterium]
MHYGIGIPNGSIHADLHTLVGFAQLAEQSGWDGVFLEDYIVWQSHQDVPTYDPWVVLAAMAMVTTRVRLGVMVSALPRRRPWKVAREAVTLDHLSHGRMTLGVGIGDTPFDVGFTHFDEQLDARRRGQMLDEELSIIAGLWRGEPFQFHGEHYRVDEITCLPRPEQSPRIPIWVGGQYPRKAAMRRAARWDGATLYRADNSDMSPDDVRALAAFIRQARGTLDGYDIAVGGRARRADCDAECAHIRALADAGATWWGEYLDPEVGGVEAMHAYVARGPLRIE